MPDKIYVAHIIDNHTLVLNAGSSSGVKLKQRFLIYSVSDHEIIDPITKESLGKLEIVKGTGKVTHLQDTICTIKSDMTEKTNKRRLIKSNSAISLVTGQHVEEFESETYELPFDDPVNGDLAKPISV